MLRLGLPITLIVLALTAPASTSAADATLRAETPEGRPVVLAVTEEGGARCLSVAVGRGPARRTSPCAEPPGDPRADVRALHVVYRYRPEKLTIIHGIASSGTAGLRVTLGDGRERVVRPRSGGAYLEVLSGRPAVATVRALDARGIVRGAADLDPRATRIERGPFVLRDLRDERGAQAQLSAFTTRLFREGSTRRARHTCVAVSSRRRAPAAGTEPGYSGGSACTTSTRSIVVRYAADCGARRLLLFGIAPAVISRLTIFTASGARLATVSASFTRRIGRSGRAFALSRRHPGPLDRLEAYGRDGALLATVELSSVGSGCASSGRS